MQRLSVVVPISLLLIFVLLFDAFSSFKSAGLILINVPLALIGGIVALWLFHIPLSVSAAIGFIALSGQAVLNGVVMLSVFQQLRNAGHQVREAVREGALQRLRTVLMDVGAEDSVRSGVRAAVEALAGPGSDPGLDTLVNAAGILRSARLPDTTLADFENVLRVNLIGTFLVIREALAALRHGDAPAVVNFSSTSANFAHPYMTAYAASKGGILAMTHALAAEFAKDGIRFNSVQPGSISSGMTDGTGESRQSVGPGLPADADMRLFAKVAPALRLPDRAIFATPEAVAAVVAMLGSPEAYFVTGTEVRIDGGAHM